MNGNGGDPLSVTFILLIYFYFFGILPWRRRKKKKVSLSKQVKFASVMLFIYSGVGFMIAALYFLLQRELSLIGVIGIVVAAEFSATAILIIKRSMHALKSLMGALAFTLFSFVYSWFTTLIPYSNTIPSILFIIGGLAGIASIYSPAFRGILAIRDFEREVDMASDSIDEKM